MDPSTGIPVVMWRKVPLLEAEHQLARPDASRILSVLLTSCCAFVQGCFSALQDAPVQTTVTQRVEAPIDLPSQFPAVEVREGHEPDRPVLALIDTGAGATLVSSRFVERNHLPLSYSSLRLSDAMGKTRDHVRVVRIDQLKIGDATLAKFDAIVDDDGSIDKFSNRLDMVLGASAFHDVLLTIDYPRRRLAIEQGSLPEPDDQEVLPLKRSDRRHLLMPAKLLGEEAWMLVDTGYTGEGILLSRHRLLGMRWASTPIEGNTTKTLFGTTRVRIGRMDGDVTLGAFSIHRPIVGISLDGNVEMIGGDVLKNFAITIDQKNNRIRLSAPTSQPIEVPPVRRLGFTTNKQGMVVLEPESEANRAGLKDGDLLISINGISIAQFSRAFIDGLKSESRPLRVRVWRAGNTLDLRVPMTTLIP
jgi:predicted aspartyl protease